ncbi:DNA-directed RNA polymerase subunit beta'' [Trichinella spiralis]|uniref:DNA-directed RNA polymerase subunit beta n=1 Tax=Trichinella spiralis TaxID=6334 RepID=A0ABR3K9M6_TRISP
MLLTAHDRGDGRVGCRQMGGARHDSISRPKEGAQRAVEVSRPATRPDQRQISLLKSIAQAQKRYNRERWWLTERTREKKTRYKNWGHQNGRPIPMITLLCREKTIHNGPASSTGPQSTNLN